MKANTKSNMLIEDSTGVIFYGAINLAGERVKRTKREYPYSYDPFLIWKGDYDKDKCNVVYSDRLIQWDYNKFNECCNKVWGNEGQYFYDRNPKDIEKFLSLYWGEKIKLTAIEECCNVSSGFPIWIFYYEDGKRV